MSGSSARPADPFEGLKWRHVLTITSVLRNCDYTKIGHLRKQYTQYASHFQETLTFMLFLRAVVERDGHIKPLAILRTRGVDDVHSWLIQRLFTTRNRYRTAVLNYIRKFHIADGEPLYCPSANLRHQQSHVRNFLMEMGIVQHDMNSDCYRMAPQHLDLYVVAKDNGIKQTPATLAALQRDKESLGTAAEEAIVSYEQKRVGIKFADRVAHVAQLNVAAGYDVRSVTIDENGNAIPRYIEVKAVSGSSLQFHWTHNEVATAKLLSQWYYLYLLPVKASKGFAMNKLKMIQDPHTAILNRSDTWAVESDLLRCCLRKESAKIPGVLIDEK